MKISKFQINAADIIRQIRNQKFSLQSALLEMIDNSIDAEASRVSIKELGGDLIIKDNGHGFEDIERSFMIGGSEKTDHIGRYGIGMKSASIKYSDETVIESNGFRGSCDWEIALNLMECPEVCIEKAKTKSGAVIVWRDFRKYYASGIQTDQIQRTYALGIMEGLEIKVNGATLTPLPFPRFVEHFDCSFMFQGKPVKVRGGLYKSDDPQRKYWQGYNIFYKGRLIGPGKITNQGTGDSCCTNFAFVVMVGDGATAKWTVTTHKDEIEDSEELLDYIYNRYTAPILKKGEEQEDLWDLKELEEAMNDLVNPPPRNGNMKRGPRVNVDTRQPVQKSGPRKKRTFSDDDDGMYEAAMSRRGRRRKQVGVIFQHLGGTDLCEITEHQKNQTVTLNLDNAFVNACRKADQKAALAAMVLISLSVYKAGVKLSLGADITDHYLKPVFELSGSELNFAQQRIGGEA